MSLSEFLQNRYPKLTILVVDDTPDHLELLSELLKSDYRVKVARNGKAALEICNSEKPPDLILLDVEMPGMNGFEVCAHLRDCKETKGIPVLFVTAKDHEIDEAAGFAVGGVDYILKPVEPSILKARVKTHLELKCVRDLLEGRIDQLEKLLDSKTPK